MYPWYNNTLSGGKTAVNLKINDNLWLVIRESIYIYICVYINVYIIYIYI